MFEPLDRSFLHNGMPTVPTRVRGGREAVNPELFEVAERLRGKAKDYELSKLAAQEQGNLDLTSAWAQMAIVLYEVANALVADSEEAA